MPGSKRSKGRSTRRGSGEPLILIDGVPYDIGQHARGNVARFKLDPLPGMPEG